MKTPNELNKIYNRLPKEKIELSKVELKRIELGIVDDLGKAMSNLEKAVVAEKELKKEIDTINKTSKSLIKEIQKVEGLRNKVEEKGEKIVKQSDSVFDQVDNIMEKARNAAKELGVKPESIANFKKAEGLMDKLFTVDPKDDFIDNIYF